MLASLIDIFSFHNDNCYTNTFEISKGKQKQVRIAKLPHAITLCYLINSGNVFFPRKTHTGNASIWCLT